MSVQKIDLLNILIIIALIPLAFFFPFPLFLFSYAVFGPLHYLTEINWLDNKNYYAKDKSVAIILILITILILASQRIIGPLSGLYIFILITCALSVSVVSTLTTNKKIWIITAVATFIVAAMLSTNQSLFTLVTVLLPTVIHVFIFTFLFMLYGSLKSKSKAGFIAIALGISACFILLFATTTAQKYTPSQYVREAYSSFEQVNLEIMNVTNIKSKDQQNKIYDSEAGLNIMRFIAFIYTYHYLNWFSKTGIIGWYKTSKTKLTIIAGIWIGSIVLYLYNYQLGLGVLFFLSLLHVILEFPLNSKSIIGIASEIKKIVYK